MEAKLNYGNYGIITDGQEQAQHSSNLTATAAQLHSCRDNAHGTASTVRKLGQSLHGTEHATQGQAVVAEHARRVVE